MRGLLLLSAVAFLACGDDAASARDAGLAADGGTVDGASVDAGEEEDAAWRELADAGDTEPEMDASTSDRCTTNGVEHPAGPLPTTPFGQVLVLDANLKEAFSRPDVADDADMRLFARRVRGIVPYAPDVVTLQEVIGPSAENVASFLTTELGHDYAVVIAPGGSGFLPGGVRRDTAVLMNGGTMVRTFHDGARDTGGFYRSSYPDRDADDGTAEAKDNAYIAVREREDGGARLAVASMHVMPVARYRSREASWMWNAVYAREIADLLAGRYGAANAYVIAGDWNNRRCTTLTETETCAETAFWLELAGRGYHDGVFTIHGGDTCMPKRIDYVFTTGTVLDADHDYTRVRGTSEGDPGYYSDHSFVWALIERS